jgi:hypothetical protein
VPCTRAYAKSVCEIPVADNQGCRENKKCRLLLETFSEVAERVAGFGPESLSIGKVLRNYKLGEKEKRPLVTFGDPVAGLRTQC